MLISPNLCKRKEDGAESIKVYLGILKLDGGSFALRYDELLKDEDHNSSENGTKSRGIFLERD